VIVVSFVIVIVCDCNFFEFELEENLEKEDFMALFFLLEHSIRFVRLLFPSVVVDVPVVTEGRNSGIEVG